MAVSSIVNIHAVNRDRRPRRKTLSNSRIYVTIRFLEAHKIWASSIHRHLQCLQSSLAQDGGANHRQHCITDLLKALKTLIKRSQQLPEIFEIVLRPIWSKGKPKWFQGKEKGTTSVAPTQISIWQCFVVLEKLSTKLQQLSLAVYPTHPPPFSASHSPVWEERLV